MFPTLFNCYFEVFCDLKAHLFFTEEELNVIFFFSDRHLTAVAERCAGKQRPPFQHNLSLMTSHTELQEAMQRLQTDMGQKESELNILRRDKYVFYHLGKEKTYELTLYLDLASFIFYKTQDFLSRADQTAAVRE